MFIMIQKKRRLLCIVAAFVFLGIHWEGVSLEISNEAMTLAFDEMTGCLVGIRQGEESFNLLSEDSGEALWQLVFTDGSILRPEEGQQFSCLSGKTDKELQLLWKDFETPERSGLEVLVTVSLAEEKAESVWHISVKAAEPLSLRQVIFPSIGALAEQEKECLAVPFWMGEKTSTARNFLNPAEAPPLRRSWEYPGLLSLQCMSFYGDDGGLLLHTRDSTAIRREFAVFGTSSDGLGLEIVHPASSDSTEFQLAGPVYLSAFTGDWYDGALLYREERDALPYVAESRVRKELLPDWVEDTGLWIWNRDVSPGVLPPAMALQDALGLPVSLFWHWWHGCAYDAGFPEYLPPREGTETFKKSLQEAQETGIHAIVYMNQRLWGMETKSWEEKDAQRFAVKGPDGTIRREIYNTFTQSPCASMCMSTPFWRNTYADIAVEALLDLGVDGIYMDQACSSLACYDPTHNHPPGGGPWWMQGFQALASDIRQRCLPVKAPALAGEGCGEAWLPHLDLMLSLQVSMERYATPGQWEPIPFFHAVYHDCARFFGNYSSLTRPPYDSLWPEKSAPDNPLALLDQKFSTQFRLEQGRSFVWGQIPCIANFQPEHLEERKAEMDFLMELAHTRQRSLKYLRDGVMLRPPAIAPEMVEIPTSRLSIYAGQHDAVQEYSREVPAVLAATWLASDGDMAVALVNITEEDRSVSLALNDKDYPLGTSGKIIQILADKTRPLGHWKEGRILQDLNLPGNSLCLVEFISEQHN
ncbi:MAG: hypothetical protein GX130_03270 [Candidatus Hydrogenedens sp.]|nr:hypothetical protein [Candidatus Hydrogenedens sp.]